MKSLTPSTGPDDLGLDREFPTGGLGGRARMLRDILGSQTGHRARSASVHAHPEPDEKAWIQRSWGVHVEPTQTRSSDPRRANAAEAFERFLHTKFRAEAPPKGETLILMLSSSSTRADAGWRRS
jgi:hypothetical protein